MTSLLSSQGVERCRAFLGLRRVERNLAARERLSREAKSARVRRRFSSLARSAPSGSERNLLRGLTNWLNQIGSDWFNQFEASGAEESARCGRAAATGRV
ncbi:MAG: hypothetical protein AUK47_15540 [Deltaproteobacteria bacterium CG2_30_63_29]|nr:MAG: hypothetical protein AUK47_15540 [Deltaproteobacteria bacterium CG2_30_63_29]